MIKNKKKLLIYPFGEQACPIIRHTNLMSEFEIAALVSPSGWGLSGEDACLADNSYITGLVVSNDFDKAIDTCDTVLLIDCNRPFNFDKYILPKIYKAVNKQKNIMITFQLDDNIENIIRNLCLENKVSFSYYGFIEENLYKYNIVRENLLNISVPVIFIIGVAENMDKFEIQLSLREELLKTEYKIQQVGTRSYSKLFGMYNFPKFMFDDKISEVQKILMFNRFIWDIELRDKPDIIIVGLPGGIIPFNNNFTNKFGILAIEASMAVKPDYTILSIPFGDYQKDNYLKFTNIVKHKLGFGVDAVVLTNVMPEWSVISQGIEMSYTRIKPDLIDSQKCKVCDLDIPVFNIFNKVDVGLLSEQLINKLERYGEVGAI